MNCKKLVSLLLVLSFCMISEIHAAFVDIDTAKSMVRGWLKLDKQPLGAKMGNQIASVDSYKSPKGEVLYYVITLLPEGFIIVPAEDYVEPIIAFSPTGIFTDDPRNPLYDFVTLDISHRTAFVKAKEKIASDSNIEFLPSDKMQSSKSRWGMLVNIDQNEDLSKLTAIPAVSDPRVPYFVKSLWGQSITECGNCYNYYTPKNYVCGCVATAMAQLLRYHEFPVTGIGVNTRTIYVDGNPQSASTRGGDGCGGAYNWSLMPLNPSISSISERQMIGSLCYDAGVSVAMSYNQDSSGTDTLKAAEAFTSIFKYSNAIAGYDSGNELVNNGLYEMVNPNLDAGLPVLLAITGTKEGGHAIVCDGYGYNNSVLYHHLNMGWSGSDNAWYALPNIGTSGNYTNVYKCVYNIFKTGTGEIISGRVTNGLTPQQGLQVTASDGAGETFTDTTDQYGIYAFVNVKSASTYTVTCNGKSQQVTTGTSSAQSKNCGNKWAVNFDMSEETFSISGTVSGDIQAGVTINVTGSGTGTTITEQDGTFTISDLSAGTYTITPSLTNYTFNPTGKSVEITTGNVAGCDFTATQGGSGNIKVTIGSTFAIFYEDELDKKPTVYAAYTENGKTKKKSVKVTDTSKDFPSKTVNLLWTSKCDPDNYDLCVKGISDGEKFDEKVTIASAIAPSITSLSTNVLVPGEELTVTGTYFGTKPKTWFEYETTVSGKVKKCKSSCKIVKGSVDFDLQTGASQLILIVPKFKSGATNIFLWVDSGTGSNSINLKK